MRYLTCTSTTHQNVDYKKPISVHKSTDYRTSTGTYHRFIPPFAQDFDVRLIDTRKIVDGPVLKSDFYLTEQNRNYSTKSCIKNPLDLEAAQDLRNVHYMRNVQEKLFKNPVPSIKAAETETKEAFKKKPLTSDKSNVFPFNLYTRCDIRSFGRDEQPPLRPEHNGYHKQLDIYLTTARASYVPYDQKKQDGIARKDIVTFYDALGVPKGGKGFGLKNGSKIEPLITRRLKNNDIKSHTFKTTSSLQAPSPLNKISEYRDEYICQTFSKLWPTLFDSGLKYKEMFPDSPPWQALSAPGMYFSENCTYGSGVPVRAVLELKTPAKNFNHKLKGSCD